jgi:outer membrane protein TolC
MSMSNPLLLARPRDMTVGLLTVVLLLGSLPAFALQPLNSFVTSALRRNPDVLEARANALQQRAQSDVALGRVLPGLAVGGSYTRNQYDAQVTLGPSQRVTVLPIDQWDGSARITIPLIDAAGWARASAAKTAANATDLQLASARLSVQAQVAQDYYQLVANLALLAAARQALEVSEEGLRLARNRYEAGVAQVLDLDRARADVEMQNQLVASADLQVSLAARALESASDLGPDVDQVVPLSDDLHAEPPLSAFEEGFESLPAVAAGAETVRAAERQADAQRLALLPSVTGSFTEHGTTAPGFVGREWSWQTMLGFTWTFDLTSVASIRSQDASAEAARSRELRTRLTARDAIYQQWETVASDIARSRSARAGQAAAAHAAEQARNRYRTGTVTQLDLLQAQRDAFAANVTRIQADADLVNARAQLRLAAGRPLLERAAR